ncbi:unnamed protein product [Durusdinium trenchii]|uniref:Peroxisomal membrane protein PEX16 n=2 Tax=Durusdinium trenchii TaxID=1381693 RepID=A0ABP0RJW6_9DINO
MIRLGVTGVKGDWPFLAKAGCLERHFGRAPKKGESRIAPKAICHLCLTGLPGYPISECSNNPRFEQTMDSAAAQVPWDTLSPLLEHLPNFPRAALMLRPDVWHNWHLGMGKAFLASAMEWMEVWLSDPSRVELVASEQRLQLVLLVLRSINELFRTLYRSGAWLDQATAKRVAFLGLQSMRGYRKLAVLSVALRQPRFPVYPKFHMLFHAFRFVELSAEANEWTESPLTDSCQMDETFIGVLSRYSRRVSPKDTISRTYDIYLTSLHQQWQRPLSKESEDDAEQL